VYGERKETFCVAVYLRPEAGSLLGGKTERTWAFCWVSFVLICAGLIFE
jgi:hypothetical protein